jgi:hypothetical protein
MKQFYFEISHFVRNDILLFMVSEGVGVGGKAKNPHQQTKKKKKNL